MPRHRVSSRSRVVVDAAIVVGVVSLTLTLVLSLSGPGPPGRHSKGRPAPSSHPREAVPPSLQFAGFASLPQFAPGSVWTTPVDGQRMLDPSSDLLVSGLTAIVAEEVRQHDGPWINTTSYSVPVYTVAAGHARVPVILDRPQQYAASLRSVLAAGVPIPGTAKPAAGADEQLVIWQPATNTMWEFWHLHRLPDGWHADWGGVMTNVTGNPGYFAGNEAGWGASGSGLPLAGGLISPGELRAGMTDHALALGIPETRALVWATPAQRTDGTDTNVDSVPEGARFRLNPSLNLDALRLPRLTLILARAAQRYGIIVRDGSPIVTFYAEDPTPSGTNPYPQLFGSRYLTGPLARFPWSQLQVLDMTLHNAHGG